MASVGHLASRLRVQRGFREDDLDDVAIARSLHGLSVAKDAKHRGVVGQLPIAEKYCFAHTAKLSVDRGVGGLGFLLLRVLFGALTLLPPSAR